MKKYLMFFIVAISATAIALAQDVSKLSISTQIFLDKMNGKIQLDKENLKLAKTSGLTPVAGSFEAAEKESQFVADPVVKDGQTYMSAFVRLEEPSAVGKLEGLGVEIQETFLDGKLVTALIPVDKIEEVAAMATVKSVRAATMMRKSTNTARQLTNVDDVLTYSADAQSAGLPSGFDGSGVVLGVIDTGIDFNHIAFKDASGNSRIKQAYVYNGSTARTYTGSSITSNLTDDNSEDHGTHTSSTAGGSSVKVSGSTVTVTNDHGSATYGGMAPGADLYLAGIKSLSDTYLSNAVRNMCTYADNQGKPLVVSNSWGSQIGPHDGTGDVADIYNSLFGDSHPNRVALFAASNDGGKSPASENGGYHVKGTSSSANPLGSILRCHYYSNTDNGYYYNGIITNAWFRSTVSSITVKILVLNKNTGAVLASTTVTPTANGTSVSGLSSYYSGSLYAYKDYVSASGKTQVLLYTSGLTTRSHSNYVSNYTLAVQIYPTNGSATLDMWGGNRCYFTNFVSTSNYTWTNGTDDGCYSDEATIANVISIGAYASKNGGTNNSYTIGDIAGFSSWGTTSTSLTGQFYPWITAPGARLIAGVNHNHTTSVDSYSYYGSNFSGDLVVNSSTNPYAYMEGTSMATPTAAGIVALWLQAANTDEGKQNYPNGLTVNDVKTIMAETAIHDSYTNGANGSHFGNGKIDALAGVQYILPQNRPKIIASPTSLDFGNVTAGTSATRTFNVQGTNLDGNISLAVNGTGFSISSTSVAKNTAQNGTGATITVTFAPTAGSSATYNGTVTLTSSNATTVTVSLTGKGVYTAPVIAANPTSVAFGTNNYTSQTYTRTVNVTGTNLQGAISAAISGTNATMFSVSPVTIFNNNGSASGTLTITYRPTAAGSHTANLVLTTTGNGANTVTVPITGTATGPSITATPNSASFEAYIGETKTQAITVKGVNLSGNVTATLNNGAGIYTIDKTSISQSEATSNNGGTITVTYAPTAAGNTTASITLSSTGCNPVTVNLSGTAKSPDITANPTSLTFTGYTGQSYTKTVTVKGNHITGNVTATLSDATGIYSIDKTTITNAQATSTNGSTITVTWTPTERGETSATLTLKSNGVEDVVIPITGNAQGGTITANPTAVTFSGYASRTYTQTVNVSGANLEQDITATLNDANGVYSIDKTTISKTASGVALTITWAPTAAGNTTASVVLTSRNADDVTINISGAAQAATPTLIVDKSSLNYDIMLSEGSNTQTITVSGRFLSEDVSVTLNDANNVFSVDKTSLDYTTINNDGNINVAVTFAPTTEGNYSGTLTLTSGSLTQTVTLYATATDKPTYIYVLTNTLEAGKEYLIVSRNATGDAYAMGHNNTAVARDAVIIKSDTSVADAVYIESEYVDETSVWTAGASGSLWTFKNGNYYATVSNGSGFGGGNRSLTFATSSTNNWTKGTNQLYYRRNSNSSYYLRYANNTFSVSTTSNNIYLYEKTQVVKKTTLTVDPVELDFITLPNMPISKSFTVTGKNLTQDVTLTLVDPDNNYELATTTININEATVGATVGVTFNAPKRSGSYRAQVQLSSGAYTNTVGLYGSVGAVGSAFSEYLDITKHSTIDMENWYQEYIDNPYKYTENETDNTVWLTLPVIMARYAWFYNDQNWLGATSGNYMIHKSETEGLDWAATDVFPGDDYYFTSTKSYGLGGVDQNNTDMYYTAYNVTNCSQVKAYGYNGNDVYYAGYWGYGSYSYPAILQIYELTENADGTLTQAEDYVDNQTSTTNSSDVVLTSIELDPSKIYRVYVAGYRSYFYEVAFRAPLVTTETTLANIERNGYPGNRFKISDELVAVYADADRGMLWCKDQGNSSIDPTEKKDGQIDYMREVTKEQVNDWDQSNWVVLQFPIGSATNGITNLLNDAADNNRKIKAGTITGRYTDDLNYTIEVFPENNEYSLTFNGSESYVKNLYCPANFLDDNLNLTEESTGAVGHLNGKDYYYFFMNPKVQEVCEITYAVWDGEKFVVPAPDGNTNDTGIPGAFTVDRSLNDAEMSQVYLSDQEAYRFMAVVQRTENSYYGHIKSVGPMDGVEASSNLIVKPLNLTGGEGNIVTAINGIFSDGYREVVGVEYVNAVGMVSDKPFQGVNIIVTRYSDGSTTTMKKVFK